MVSRNNIYISSFFAIYIIALLYLHFAFQLAFREFYQTLFIIGIGLSSIAWVLTKNLTRPYDKPLIKNESLLLIALILWVAFYITFGGSLINKLFPTTWLENQQAGTVITFIKKLFVFVLIPYTIYKLSGFNLGDFGFINTERKSPGGKTLVVFILISITSLLFQFYFSNGAKPIRTGHFSVIQLLTGLPLCFVYLIFDAGLIEEFFFRGLLQSRLSLLLRSSVGGIVCTALIFGLVHAPGLFLRGAQSEGMEEQMPFLFWAAYTITYMSVVGIFLGIIFNKTKNLWLVMAIHAMFDLLPNFPEFVKIWNL